MTVSKVMTKNPAFCAPSSSAQTAALVMQQKDTIARGGAAQGCELLLLQWSATRKVTHHSLTRS